MSNPNIDESASPADSLVGKIGSLTGKFEKVASERGQLRAELDAAKDRESRLRRENSFLQDRLKDVESRSKEKADDVDRLEVDLQDAGSRLKRTEWARQELTRYEEHTKEEVAKLRNQLVDLAERRDVLENELAVSKKLVDTLRTERDSQSGKHQGVQSNFAELQREHESAQSDLARCKREYETLQKEFGAFPPSAREKLQEELCSTRERLEELEGDFKKCSGRLAGREDALLERDLEIQALRRQVSKAFS